MTTIGAPARRADVVPARGRPRLVATVLAATLAGLGSISCGALLPPADLQPPTVSFEDLSIDSVSLERVRFTVRIATQNPNAIDIPLSNVRFDLSLLGQPVAKGRVTEQRFRLPAKGRLELPIDFTVSTSDLRALAARIHLGPSSDAVWALEGTANWGASPFPIPFAKRGDANSLKKLRELFGGRPG